MRIKANKTKHYKVAGRLEKGQVVEVDQAMGELLLSMHPELEEVDKPKPATKKKEEEKEEEKPEEEG